MAADEKNCTVDFTVMKILFITDLYPPFVKGGYELRCQETAEELSRRGHEIIVLTSQWGTDNGSIDGSVFRALHYNELIYTKEKSAPDATAQRNKNHKFFQKLQNLVKKFLKNDPIHLRTRIYQVIWAIKNRQNYRISHDLISTIHPDLVFIWNMGFVGLAPILASQALGLITVFSIGDYWLVHLKTELLQESNVFKKKFRAVIIGFQDFSQLNLRHLMPDSTVLKNIYIQNGFPEQNLHVVTRGVKKDLVISINKLGELPRKTNGFMKLLFVGRLVPDKAPDVAIKTVDILRNKYGMTDIKLDIVGQGSAEYSSLLKKTIFDLGLESNINLLGWVEHSIIFEQYFSYDALVFPSRWVEPLGGTVLEAMSRGLPVISSKRGGPEEIITHGENGFLVQVDEPEEFALTVLKLYQNEDLTQKIRRAGVQTINERYTLENIVNQYEEYFQKLKISRDPTSD
jgi:glycogen synthase